MRLLLRRVDLQQRLAHLGRGGGPLLGRLGQQLQDELLEVGRAVSVSHDGATGGVLMCWEMTAVGSSPRNGGRPVTIS